MEGLSRIYIDIYILSTHTHTHANDGAFYCGKCNFYEVNPQKYRSTYYTTQKEKNWRENAGMVITHIYQRYY